MGTIRESCSTVTFFWIILITSANTVNSFAHNDFLVLAQENIRLNESKNILSQRHFIIGTIEIAPYVIIHYTADKGIRHVDGFVPQIIKWMADKYNFTYEYVTPPDIAYGAFVNGSWNGLVGMIIRGDIDIAATSLSVTYPRSLVVDFTLAFLDDPLAILLPFPELDSTITGIVKPFQYEVWIGIIASLLIASIALWLISRFELRNIFTKSFKGKLKLFPQLWFLFRTIANPNDIIHFTLASRIVVTSWCLATLVLVNTYNSCLVSYLMAPKFSPGISTIQELADSKQIQFTVLKHTSIDSMISSATSGAFAKIGNILRAHPENYLTSLEGLNDLVAFHHKAHSQEETALRIRLQDDYKLTNQCRLTIGKEPLSSENRLAFALPKTSHLLNIFNNEIVRLRQLGLLNHWENSYLPKSDSCTAQLSPSSLRTKSNKSLTINFLSSAFLLYGVGVVVSISAFLLEVLCKIIKVRPASS